MTTPVAVPVGKPVDDSESAWELKYEKLKTRAKYFNVVAAALLVLVAIEMQTKGTQACSPMLVKVVFLWLAVLGTLLLLAELSVKPVLDYVHVLSYRSGRALVGLMCGTVCMAAAPSELPVAAVGYAPSPRGGQSYFVTQVQWEFFFTGLLVTAGALYNIRLTVRSKAHKLGGRSKCASGAASSSSQPGKARELV